MTKLDEVAINIELVLISIIEGVALTNLAGNAMPFLHPGESLEYLPYILAGLVILLVFWSQAILHAVSFIRWPLKMEHMLLYFVAVFLQVLAYNNMTDLSAWFFWWTIFSILALFIYIVDLRIIRQARPVFAKQPGGTTYLQSIEQRHLFELRFLVPIALMFNLVALWIALSVPDLSSYPVAFIALGSVQCLVSLGALIDCVRNFGERSALLPSLFG